MTAAVNDTAVRFARTLAREEAINGDEYRRERYEQEDCWEQLRLPLDYLRTRGNG